MVAAAFLAFLTHAPNRLLTGAPISAAQVFAGERLWALTPFACIGWLATRAATKRNSLLIGLAATVLAAAVFAVAGSEASRLVSPDSPSARTSLGGGFWSVLLVAWLIHGQSAKRAGLGPLAQFALSAGFVLPLAVLLFGGWLNDVSIVKEYANRQDVFVAAVGRHVEIVALTLGFSLAIGLPLGVLAFRRPAWRSPLFSTLGIIQTVPSIALFGLLMPPLAGLAAGFPALAGWGISGIGLAPAIVALTLYSLLPLTRSVVAGLGRPSAGLLEAARGVGFTNRRIFWSVEAPLAMPVFLSGLRVCVVQTIGIAVVAALIGAGGLGSLMFQGLFSSAIDLVLLGVVPTVLMAALADALFRLGASLLEEATE